MGAKDAIEVVKSLGIAPWLVSTFTTVVLLGWVFSRLSGWFAGLKHSRREKFDWLVAALEKPAVRSSRFLVEQAYQSYIGSAMSYDDLEALLRRENPSDAVNAYNEHRRFVVIRNSDGSLQYHPKYAVRQRRAALRAGWLAGYAASAGLLGMLLEFHGMTPPSAVGAIMVLLLLFALGALACYTALVDVDKFMEPGKLKFWPRLDWRAPGRRVRRFVVALGSRRKIGEV